MDPSDLRIPPVVLATAAKEVAFVCGRASAADALNEEEDDEGIEEARKLTRKRGATSKRARTEADEPATPSSRSSPSWPPWGAGERDPDPDPEPEPDQ